MKCPRHLEEHVTATAWACGYNGIWQALFADKSFVSVCEFVFLSLNEFMEGVTV